MSNLLEKIQELIDSEVHQKIMQYARLISKKHDISLKLLLQDISSHEEKETDDVLKNSQCLGVTARGSQCKFSGKQLGYCGRHTDQMKKKSSSSSQQQPVEKNVHVGHTMKECMFLAGCPACEKTRKPVVQNLLIDF